MKTENNKSVKRFNKFVADYQAWTAETEDGILYEDETTRYTITDICIKKTMVTFKTNYQGFNSTTYNEKVTEDWDLDEWTDKFRKDLRRAKRYWEMDGAALDKIAENGDQEDEE